MIKTVIGLIGLFFMMSCSVSNNFHNPYIRTDNFEKINRVRFNEMREAVNELVYIGELIDTVALDTLKTQNHFNFDLTNTIKNSNGALKIKVDLNQKLAYDLEKLSIPPVPILLDSIKIVFDSIETRKQLEKWENRKRNYVDAIPVTIINSTKETTWLVQQDFQILMIQEAKDIHDKWKPIEYWNFSNCGNSYGRITLKSNEIAIFKILKYSGDFKTEIRLKIRNGNQTYYSKPFKGSVNLKQFEIPEEQFSERDLNKKESEKLIEKIFLKD